MVFIAALLVDKAMELRYIGGVFGGNVKPTPFLCLTLKMLQIQPEKDIVIEFIRNEDFKSVCLYLYVIVFMFFVIKLFINTLMYVDDIPQSTFCYDGLLFL